MMKEVENMNTTNISYTIEAEDYDSNLCRDGGSYYQPFIRAVAGNEEFCIDDSSCGDFGSRIMVWLNVGGKEVARAYYGSMLNDGQSYTEFDYGNPVHAIWLDWANEQGYYIPCKE